MDEPNKVDEDDDIIITEEEAIEAIEDLLARVPDPIADQEDSTKRAQRGEVAEQGDPLCEGE